MQDKAHQKPLERYELRKERKREVGKEEEREGKRTEKEEFSTKNFNSNWVDSSLNLSISFLSVVTILI